MTNMGPRVVWARCDCSLPRFNGRKGWVSAPTCANDATMPLANAQRLRPMCEFIANKYSRGCWLGWYTPC
jgi:hypothetical protein